MKKRFCFKYTHHNENGYTLIIAILTLVVISVLGLGLMNTTATTMKQSSSERENQSAYYIAESGVTQERVEIKKLAKEAFDETKVAEAAYINALKDHQEPEPFDFQTEFIQTAKAKINSQYTNLLPNTDPTIINDSDLKEMSSKVKYTKQKGIEPTSTTTVKPDLQNSTSQKLIYTIQSTGKIGENNKRSISQKIQISLDQNPGKKEVVIEDKTDTTTPKLNACYAIYTYGSINSGSGTINGDVYSTKKIEIGNNGASYNGNVYSTEDIVINGSSGIKNVYSQKNVTLGGGNISGSVYGNNIFISGYPNISKDVIALNNINITSWVNINGQYKYGNSFSNTTTSQEASKASQLTNEEKEELINEYSLESNPENVFHNSCTASIPKLEDADTVFKKPTNIPILNDKTITSTDGSGTSFDFIKNGTLTVNSKARNQTLSLDSDIYLKKINITGNETLNIDLKGQSHSLYVDSLDLAGEIKLTNPGTLNLYVKDQMNFAYGSINSNGNSSQANIYYGGSDKLTIASNINLMSSLHVKNADLTLTAGSQVKGNIYVYGNNNVEVSGGSNDVEQLFLAPNSNFIQSGGGTINGNIVAKAYTNSGGATVNPPTKTDQPGTTNPGGGSTTTIELDDYPNTTDEFLFVQSQIEENGEKEN
ncbi:PilX N-terminal domain-containing pilus assembly protein [Rummeliibacillus suwonensis]|uniref:PilX N-terminal domain-containing pilus assembly protein n=1 Tax=Rummeliibacillus suwonensis TaxID=1306154 RepID=UPI0011B539DE|nr:PilX N-terminal domain-containing pilus assembly protein [Rummeliibacillus suwonensis]